MSAQKCPCGGIILADTEDWNVPLCANCYEKFPVECYAWDNEPTNNHRWCDGEEAENAYAALRSENESLRKAIESAIKTMMYTQEEYAHGHGVNLIGESIRFCKKALGDT